MSKLEELIQELCPDGVEYKKLGEVATISRGGNLQKKDCGVKVGTDLMGIYLCRDLIEQMEAELSSSSD